MKFFKFFGHNGFFFRRKTLSRQSRLTRTRSDHTRLILPRPIDCGKVTEQPVKFFPQFSAHFLVRASPKKSFLSATRSSHDLHPHKSPLPDFRDCGVIFRATKAGKRKCFLARQASACANILYCLTKKCPQVRFKSCTIVYI